MISYKKVNLLKLVLSDDMIIKNKETELEIKSPIILYEIKNDKLFLTLNINASPHNHLMHICSYIYRLFNVNNINCDFISTDKIILNINDSSKFYN